MLLKGKVSSVEKTTDRNGDAVTARIVPDVSGGSVTRPLVIPWYLRGRLGNLAPGVEVACAVFEDGSGVILARMDGERGETLSGDLTIGGTLTVSGDVSAGGVSLKSHTHAAPDGETSVPH